MNRLLGSLLALGLLLAPGVAMASSAGIWRFDEGQGPWVADESVHANVGRVVESAPGAGTFTDGMHGQAIVFAAPGGRVLVPTRARSI